MKIQTAVSFLDLVFKNQMEWRVTLDGSPLFLRQILGQILLQCNAIPKENQRFICHKSTPFALRKRRVRMLHYAANRLKRKGTLAVTQHLRYALCLRVCYAGKQVKTQGNTLGYATPSSRFPVYLLFFVCRKRQSDKQTADAPNVWNFPRTVTRDPFRILSKNLATSINVE